VSEEKRFELLANIMRASHFEWRRAVASLCPDLDPTEAVKRYWEEVGKDTAAYYLKKINPDKGIAEQLAALYVASSVAMGEDAAVVASSVPGESLARHEACPWFDWHKREGLLHEDQVGCDYWLRTVVDEINKALGTELRFETVESLPAGGSSCLRRFWDGGR
jgi:hypothetical protein